MVASGNIVQASLCGHYEVVELLLESGALCERDTFQGERLLSPLSLGALKIADMFGSTDVFTTRSTTVYGISCSPTITRNRPTPYSL